MEYCKPKYIVKKFLYYIAIVSVLLGCKAQYITQSNLKSGYEILDINKYDRRKKIRKQIILKKMLL